MSYAVDGYHRDTVASAPVSERVAFIRRTYAHLGAAVLVFVGLTAALIATGMAEPIVRDVFLGHPYAWLGLMAVFIGGTLAAHFMAQGRRSVATQYAGLAIYVLLYTLLFLPILTIASDPRYGIGHPRLPLQAGIVTLAAFGGLTAAAFVSRKDFSFLGSILMVAVFLALGVIVAAVAVGFTPALGFVALAVALFAGFIVFYTSRIIHRYRIEDHVAASMTLLGSFALLFYSILGLFLTARDD